jgi:hypothetical protein
LFYFYFLSFAQGFVKALVTTGLTTLQALLTHPDNAVLMTNV